MPEYYTVKPPSNGHPKGTGELPFDEGWPPNGGLS